MNLKVLIIIILLAFVLRQLRGFFQRYTWHILLAPVLFAMGYFVGDFLSKDFFSHLNGPDFLRHLKWVVGLFFVIEFLPQCIEYVEKLFSNTRGRQ